MSLQTPILWIFPIMLLVLRMFRNCQPETLLIHREIMLTIIYSIRTLPRLIKMSLATWVLLQIIANHLEQTHRPTLPIIFSLDLILQIFKILRRISFKNNKIMLKISSNPKIRYKLQICFKPKIIKTRPKITIHSEIKTLSKIWISLPIKLFNSNQIYKTRTTITRHLSFNFRN